MSIYCAAVKKDGRKIIGYQFVNEADGMVLPMSRDNIEIAALSACANVEYDTDFGGLVGVDGFSISSLPIYENGRLAGRLAVVVTDIIEDQGQAVGVSYVDGVGNRQNVTFNALRKAGDTIQVLNAKVLADGSVERLDGTPFDSLTLTSLSSNTYNSGLGEKKVRHSKMPKRAVYDIKDVIERPSNQDAQRKMTEAMAALKQLSLYYWIMFDAVDKSACDERVTETLAVSESKFYYNPDFVTTISVDQLVFIFIHELNHIGMRHVLRGRYLDPRLWNIATDMYINEIILREFDLSVGQTKQVNGVQITAPSDCIYAAQIDEALDFAKDIPEVIYRKLLDENQNNSQDGQQDGQNGQNSSGDSEGSNSQSQPGNGQNGQNNEDSDQNNQGQSQDTKKQGKGKQNQSTKSNKGDAQSDEADGQPSEKGSKQAGSGGEGGLDPNEGGTVTFNGKEIKGRSYGKMISETGMDSDEAFQESEHMAENKIATMDTKVQQVEQELGEKLSARTPGSALLKRYIEIALGKSTLDWKTILKNMCKYKPKTQYTLTAPHRAYMNMGRTYATKQKMDKEREITTIKICVDVSGSIGEKELNWYLTEVAGIFKAFKAKGELIYWSTKVGDAGDFERVEDIKKVIPNSTGGTDLACVFEYLSGQTETMTKKKEKTRVNDIVGVLIITDGYFSEDYGEYEKAFGRKTLFIVNDNKLFQPLFGRVAYLDKPE